MSSLLKPDDESADFRLQVRISGWVRTSLLDFPGRVASTLFLPGCNFRCAYCHNPGLVAPPDHGSEELEDPEKILSYLDTYSRLLEGVCITGGEPLLQPGLEGLCRAVRNLGLKVKLDTNGSLPEPLGRLLRQRLLDYVAVDIKGPPGKIAAVAGTGAREDSLTQDVETTLGLLRQSGIPYELRTTVVPGLLEREDLVAIGRWLKGAPRYFLQQFRPGRTLDPGLQNLEPYPPDYLKEIAAELAGCFGQCTVRGIG
ncbi:MAG: anaerobic ribonucleoside-triphosphate reductase activating protein [bacterium]